MKNLQKGFIVPVLLVIIALLAIGGGVYVYENKKTEAPILVDTGTNQLDQNQQQLSIQTPPVNTQQEVSPVSITTRPSIRVLSPNGGETVKSGGTVSIKWDVVGLTNQDRVYISISDYSASHFDTTTINAGDTPATQGQYNWTIPSHYKIGSMYKISVYTATQKYTDSSDSYFTIQTNTPVPTPMPATKELSFKSCITSLYQENRSQYDFWKAKFAGLHPEFRSIYDAGSYCELSDGTKLISFSHFMTTDPKSAGQTVALFTTNNSLVRETKGFYCQTIGDLGTPKFDSIENNKVKVSCSSGDAGHVANQEYELNLNDFTYVMLKNEFKAAQ